MPDTVYKHIQLTGTSQVSIEDAVNKALGRAAKTVNNMSWFEILENRGAIKDGQVAQWQTTIRVGFAIDE